MLDIVEGLATPSQIAAFVTALRMKGETAEEIAGLARIMRRYATRVEAGPDAIDIVGTGGDGGMTFNISTVSAHRGRGGAAARSPSTATAASPASAAPPTSWRRSASPSTCRPTPSATCIGETGFGFMFAPIYHPAMRHAVVPRREIGVRTAFNLLGPITNPAGVTSQVTGVASPTRPRVIAEVLRLLGSRRALVVHSQDGLDEISIAPRPPSTTSADGTVREYEVTPEAVGLQRAPMSRDHRRHRRGEPPDGAGGPGRRAGPRARDAILLNAGGWAGRGRPGRRPAGGVKLAAERSTAARPAAKLDQVREVSTALKRETAGRSHHDPRRDPRTTSAARSPSAQSEPIELAASGTPRSPRSARDFAAALAQPGVSIIAEIKRQSPAKGALRLDMDAPPWPPPTPTAGAPASRS